MLRAGIYNLNETFVDICVAVVWTTDCGRRNSGRVEAILEMVTTQSGSNTGGEKCLDTV